MEGGYGETKRLETVGTQYELDWRFYSGFISFSASFRLGIRLLWVSCTPVGMQHPQVLTPDLRDVVNQ